MALLADNYREIFLRLDLASLSKFCGTNKLIYQLCQDESLWKMKTLQDYDVIGGKNTYIKLYNLPFRFPVEQWAALVQSLQTETNAAQVDNILFLLENVNQLKDQLRDNLYANNNGSTILYYLLQLKVALAALMVEMDDDESNLTISLGLSKLFFDLYKYILDLGYNVNRTANDLLLPLTDVLTIEPLNDQMDAGILDDDRVEFVKLLLKHGVNLTNDYIWDGLKVYDDYLELYLAYNSKPDQRIIDLLQ